MNILVFLVRLFQAVTAFTFIFSGFVKLNDPLGLSYKLEEYFASHVLDLPWLIPYALPVALCIIFFEILCGVALLIGIWRKQILLGLLGLTLFFAFLTFYSAYYNKVTDCGCFGDAIPLTPWQSFYKDIALLVLVLCALWGFQKTYMLFTFRLRRVVLSVFFSISLFVAIYVLNALPLIDFRPYKEGVNIDMAMQIPEDAPKDVYDEVWIYSVDGVEKQFKTSEAPWDIPGAEYVDRKTILVKQGYHPPVHDFSISSPQGKDLTDSILKLDRVLLVLTYDIDKMNISALKTVIGLHREFSSDLFFCGLAPVSLEKTAQYRAVHAIPYEVCFTDPTTIKTIVRGNPGLVLLKKGVITKKWGERSPSSEELRSFL